MNTSKRVLLLTPATSYRTSDFLDAARRLNVEVVIGTNEQLISAGFATSRIIKLDFCDHEASARKISDFAKLNPLTAVIGVDETSTIVAATASRALDLTHNDPATIEICHDKYAFRKIISEHGLLSPDFRRVPFVDLHSVADCVHYPCVLKPLSLSASRGVIRVDSPDEFVIAGERIRQILSDVDNLPENHRDSLLCESFIPGREVELEGIIHRGQLSVLALFDKPDSLDGPYFEETIYITPSRLNVSIQNKITDTVSAACKALGLATGPIHAELRVNDQGAWLIELAARSIGGRCAKSLRFGADASLEELILNLAIDDNLPETRRERLASGVMMLPIRCGGQLAAVNGLAKAREVPGISDVIIDVRPGETLVPLPEGDRYLGFIFARGESPACVEEQLRLAERKLSVEFE